MAKHAYLAASASERWLKCPPSAKLCAQEEDRGSPYAQQGTDAHELAAYLAEKALGRRSRDPTGDLTWYDAEMQEAAEGYAAFVMEQVAEAKSLCSDPLVCIEQTLDFSKWVEHGFGTGDCVIVADDLLHIVDLKYGLGILVSASGEDGTGNSQLKCYALGALDTFGDLYDIRRIKLSIYQPRRGNVDTFELSREDLLKWADEVLAPIAKLAYDGLGDFAAGDHCQFCKVKASCDIKSYALEQALSGVRYPGFKLVEGRSNRKYTDEVAVATVVSNAGYDPYEKKLLGITAMTRQLGKKKFDELLSGLIVKPQGKPVLAPATDKRPEFNTAQNDFMEE